MDKTENVKKLKFFISEKIRYASLPLYEYIIRKAREQGLAGARAMRCIQGFGPSHRIHSTKLLDLSSDLPIVIDIIDTEEKVRLFLKGIDSAIEHAMAVIENVEVCFYRKVIP